MTKSTTVPYFGELSPVFTVDAIINSGAQESQAIDLGALTLCGLGAPSSITGTTCSLENQVVGTAYQDVYDEYGSLVTYTLAASHYVALDPVPLLAVQQLKVKMGAAQATTTSITLVAKRL